MHNTESCCISIPVGAPRRYYKDKHKPKANIFQFHHTLLECRLISIIYLQTPLKPIHRRYLFPSQIK